MSRSILLIDDEQHFLLALSARLRTQGLHVVTARGGTAGLAEAARTPPDAVICDMSMPTLDGLETIKRIRKVEGCQGVPVIFLTANTRQRCAAHTHELPGTCFAQKPCDFKRLLEMIQAATSYPTHGFAPSASHA